MGLMTVIEKVLELSIVMFLGFLIVKTKYVDSKVREGISKIIVKVLLPCLIISSISSETFAPERLGELGLVFLMALFCISTMYAVGAVSSKLLKIPEYTKKVHKIMSCAGNAIFIGLPIITAMYGEQGFFYAIIYWLLNDLFLWTIGVIILSEDKTEGKGGFIKKLLNPNTISFVIAIIMFVLGIKLPPIVHNALSGVGKLTTNLSMIFIGMTLATVDAKSVLKKWWILVVTPVKLIIMPILFILIFNFIGIKEIILGVVVLEAAMPVQTVLSIVANEHNADYEYASTGIFVTTIVSLITLPFICYLLQTWVN